MQHWPIVRTALAAIISLFAVTLLHRHAFSVADFSPSLLGWVFVGALYTQFVEYWCHRVPMHRRVKLLEQIRLNHLQHHRVFHGKRFQTKDTARFEDIPGRYWAFPILFFLHYAALVWLLPIEVCLAFLLGTVLHYLAFEISHWLTHLEDNAVDRWIAPLPWLGALRLRQIEHHRIHHERPDVAFNFIPPYLGDRLAGCMPPREALVPAAKPIDAEDCVSAVGVVASSPWRTPLIRYGSVAAASVALVGAVVLAHGLWAHYKDTTHSEQTS